MEHRGCGRECRGAPRRDRPRGRGSHVESDVQCGVPSALPRWYTVSNGGVGRHPTTEPISGLSTRFEDRLHWYHARDGLVPLQRPADR